MIYDVATKTYANTQFDLAKFFSSGGKIVSWNEFLDFWNSLTFEEMEYYRWVSLD